MALLEITVVPLGTGSTSVSEYVAACHRVLEKEEGAMRVFTSMKIDDRRDKETTIDGKIAPVESKL